MPTLPPLPCRRIHAKGLHSFSIEVYGLGHGTGPTLFSASEYVRPTEPTGHRLCCKVEISWCFNLTEVTAVSMYMFKLYNLRYC